MSNSNSETNRHSVLHDVMQYEFHSIIYEVFFPKSLIKPLDIISAGNRQTQE